MKRNYLLVSIIILISALLSCSDKINNPDVDNIPENPFEGGLGTIDKPFQVSTLDQLQEINNFKEFHFVQINNIDASATEFWNEGEGFEPIGRQYDDFTGSYDGQNFEIINLHINRNSIDQGLFGSISRAEIKNLKVLETTINGGSQVGILVGIMFEGEVSNILVSGNLISSSTAGGLIGYNSFGTVFNSRAIDLTLSNNSGIPDNFGGLIGINNGGNIQESFAEVTIETEGSRIGGLIGAHQQGIVSKSYAIGKVAGTDKVGGLLGVAILYGSLESKIQENYSAVEVYSEDEMGGFIGVLELSDESEIRSNYWDVELSMQFDGISNVTLSEVEGLPTSEMIGSNASEHMWKFNWGNTWRTTDDYPILQWEEN